MIQMGKELSEDRSKNRIRFVPCFLEQGVKLHFSRKTSKFMGTIYASPQVKLLAFSFSTVFLIFRKMLADVSNAVTPHTCIRGLLC